MPDSDNTYLAKIAKSCKAIEAAFTGAPVPLPEDMSFQTAVGEALNLTSVGGGAKGFVAYLTEP